MDSIEAHRALLPYGLPYLLSFLSQTLPPILGTFFFLAFLPFNRSLLRSHGIIALAIALSLIHLPTPVLPSCSSSSVEVPIDGVGFVISAIAHAIAGVLLAYPIVAALEMIPMAGRLIDVARGAQSAEQMIPGLEGRSSPLESIGFLIAPALAFSTGAHHIALDLLCNGLWSGSLAGDTLPSPGGETDSARLVHSAMAPIANSIRAASPALLCVLLFEIGVGATGRLIPKVQLGTEFQVVKSLGVILLCSLVIRAGPVLPADKSVDVQRPAGVRTEWRWRETALADAVRRTGDTP